MGKVKGTRGMFVILILVLMMVGYYAYLSNRNRGGEEEVVKTTKVQEVLLRDLNRNYPATPREVVKYYSEITQCFYNEEYSEEELKQLAEKAKELYDDELAAAQSEDEYLSGLKRDISLFKRDNIVISSYKTSSSTDVNYFTKDGYECASLFCAYTLRMETSLQGTEEVFILRKDAGGHWKILGWDVADEKMKNQGQ